MNDYLPKWACEKLEAMGCVCESGYVWRSDNETPILKVYLNSFADGTPAFHPWDFVGTSEQARKNAYILWPDKYVCSDCGKKLTEASCSTVTKKHVYTTSALKFHRHACIESDNAVEYICGFLKEGE